MPQGLPERIELHRVQTREDVAVPRRLLASWQRSEDYGVSLESVDPVFTGTSDLGSLFHQCGSEVLQDLHRTLANEPVGLMLTDAEGVVLSAGSAGTTPCCRRSTTSTWRPGFAYSERDVGTNGLGLALTDRVPTLVRADQHYALSLCTFTCAAVPVLDPETGPTRRLRQPHHLVAVVQRSAAGAGPIGGEHHRGADACPVQRQAPPAHAPRSGVPRGGAPRRAGLRNAARVVRRLEFRGRPRRAGDGGRPDRGRGRRAGVGPVDGAGAGGAAHLSARPHPVRDARPPRRTVQTWLRLWTPELGKAHTAVIVRDVDLLPAWVADQLRDLVVRSAANLRRCRSPSPPSASTRSRRALAGLVDTVVTIPPLRDRPDDVPPLADHIARRMRGQGRRLHRGGNAGAAQLRLAWQRRRAHQGDHRCGGSRRHVDVAILPAEVLSGGSRHLSRIEAFERGEIVRVLSVPGPQDGRRGKRTRHEPGNAVSEDHAVRRRGASRRLTRAHVPSGRVGLWPARFVVGWSK